MFLIVSGKKMEQRMLVLGFYGTATVHQETKTIIHSWHQQVALQFPIQTPQRLLVSTTTNFMKSKQQLESDIGLIAGTCGQKGKKLAVMASFILRKMAIGKKRDHINLQKHNPEIILMLLALRANFPFIIFVRFWLFHDCFKNEI